MKISIALIALGLACLTTASPIPSKNLELGDLFEGDMILQPGQKNGLVDTRYRWPDSTIHYTFGPNVLETEKTRIREVLEEYNRSTCVKVIESATATDRVVVTTENSGCWSYVGRLGGTQQLNLQAGSCQDRYGTILHEFLHALGFYHMQSDPTRDDFVAINWDNIVAGYERNFDKYAESVANSNGVEYDYDSVMHYPRNAFAINTAIDTITPVDSGVSIGQRLNFSEKDIQKLNMMYPCAA